MAHILQILLHVEHDDKSNDKSLNFYTVCWYVLGLLCDIIILLQYTYENNRHG